MIFVVTQITNFCRVFELPLKYPNDYCFSGGIPVELKMVDWFNPFPEVTIDTLLQVDTELLYKVIGSFVLNKNYIVRGRWYLVIFDFKASIIVSK